MTMARRFGIAGLGLILSGCREELGPVKFHVANVTGVVREGSRRIPRGWIEFVPVKGTVGNLRSARLLADGSFKARGVAVGENLIRLVDAPFDSRGAAQLFRTFNSPIRRIISDRSSTPIDVDLVEEVIRFQGKPKRESRTESSGSRVSR